MNRVKEAQESLNAPKIDKAAAKRFIKSALWQKAKQQQENSSQSEVQPSSSSGSVPSTFKYCIFLYFCFFMYAVDNC